MEVVILKDAESVSQLVASRIESLLKDNKQAVLGLATGSSPQRLYEILINKYNQNLIDFSMVKAFNLDEYVGLGENHSASYASYMQEKFFSKINIKKQNCFIPNGLAHDLNKECENYEKLLKQHGPIDLQLLGIGRDGHIGFNEPISSLQSRTRLKTLTQETRQDNSQYFLNSEEIPYHVITMGIGTIMEAKEIVLIAFGENKADAIAQAVEGPLTSMVPASVLQLHRKVKIVVDEKAASKLKNRDYYRWVFDKKPDWQRKEFS